MSEKETLIFPAESVRISFVYSLALPSDLPITGEKGGDGDTGFFFASDMSGFDPAQAKDCEKVGDFEENLDPNDLAEIFGEKIIQKAAISFSYSLDGAASFTLTVDCFPSGNNGVNEATYYEVGDVSRRKRMSETAQERNTLQSWVINKVRSILDTKFELTNEHLGNVEERLDFEISSFQSPYIFSWVKLFPNKQPPWQDSDPCISAIRQILCALIRPLHWSIYLDGSNKFRVRDSAFKDKKLLDADLFLHEDGVLMYHPRSTLLLTRNSYTSKQKGDANKFDEISLYVWQDALKIITSVRSRWHLYSRISSDIDGITRSILGSPDFDVSSEQQLVRLSALREQFILSLNADLPKTHSATHLIDLATKVEDSLQLDQLYMYNMRKFESLNWLIADKIDQMKVKYLMSDI